MLVSDRSLYLAGTYPERAGVPIRRPGARIMGFTNEQDFVDGVDFRQDGHLEQGHEDGAYIWFVDLLSTSLTSYSCSLSLVILI